MRIIDADILTYASSKNTMLTHIVGRLQSAVHGKTRVAIATTSLLETFHALVEDYQVEREEAAYKLDGLTRNPKNTSSKKAKIKWYIFNTTFLYANDIYCIRR